MLTSVHISDGDLSHCPVHRSLRGHLKVVVERLHDRGVVVEVSDCHLYRGGVCPSTAVCSHQVECHRLDCLVIRGIIHVNHTCVGVHLEVGADGVDAVCWVSWK